MKKFILALATVAVTLPMQAITYTYGEFRPSSGTCSLTGWGGQQPTSGKLTLKDTYEQDGVTYTVTRIAAHALDNLTEVTEITIPATVKEIGGATTGYLRSAENFANCPKLTRFVVATGNRTFAASGAGLLMLQSGTTVVRVPQAVTTTNGTLNMSNSVTTMCVDAFAENSSIKILGLPSNLTDFNTDYGFSTMTSLTDFAVSNGATPLNYKITGGVVLSADGQTLLVYPPCHSGASYTVPSGVTQIGANAFKGAMGLYSVTMPGVGMVGREAFAKSGVTAIDLGSQLWGIGDGAFRDCPRLSRITLGARVTLPADMARDCKMLSKVEAPTGVVDVLDNCFNGCERLVEFPFEPKMMLHGNYSFAGCGFTEVNFGAGNPSKYGIEMGDGVFMNCASLVTLDMSGVKLSSDGAGCEIGYDFVTGCNSLRNIYWPEEADFWGNSDSPRYAVGLNSPVQRLAFKSFRLSGTPAAAYDHGTHNPVITLAGTTLPNYECSLSGFFSLSGGAILRPTVCCEAYDMTAVCPDGAWLLPNATYYVPGKTADRYSAVANNGGTVSEMFSIETYNEAGRFCIMVRSLVDGIEFGTLAVNGGTVIGTLTNGGSLVTREQFDAVNDFTVSYKLNGVDMTTTYPDKGATTGVADLEANPNAPYRIVDMQGRVVARGEGVPVFDRLPAGVYVLDRAGRSSKIVF